MNAQDEEALRVWQSNRDTDRAVLAALLDECLQPAEYTATLEIVRREMADV